MGSFGPLDLVRIALATLTLAAISTQLQLHLAAGHDPTTFFGYFTILANLFATAVLVMTVAVPPAPRGPRDALRYLSTVNMVVVGLVFAILLRDEDVGDLQPWINAVLHALMPCAVLADWLSERPVRRVRAHSIALALAIPAVYLAVTLWRGSGTGWYPYPFLDPARAGGDDAVAAYAVGIAVLFIVVAAAVRAIANVRRTDRLG